MSDELFKILAYMFFIRGFVSVLVLFIIAMHKIERDYRYGLEQMEKGGGL